MERNRYMAHVTLVGGLVNLALVFFKFYAGLVGNSQAMLADAAHSLSDLASDLIILLCLRMSAKPEDEDHAYGHGKFETLAAVLLGILLLLCGLGLFWNSAGDIARYFHGGKLETPGWLPFWAALVSILVKEALYQYTSRAARRVDSGALLANAWHHRSDALSSIATIIGIGGARLPGDGWLLMDPLAACVISFFIGGVALNIMRPALGELMEKALPAAEKAKIEKIIRDTPGVMAYHHLRTRRVGGHCAIEAHIKLNGDLSLKEAHDIASELEKRLREAFGPETHSGIHMEPAKGQDSHEQGDQGAPHP